MPDSVVNRGETLLDITQVGNQWEFSTREGGTASIDCKIGYGDATAVSITVKKRLSGGRVQAFSSAITLTSGNLPYFKDDIDTTGASAIVVNVGTAGTTANSMLHIVAECKGDRIIGSSIGTVLSAPAGFTNTPPPTPPLGE